MRFPVGLSARLMRRRFLNNVSREHAPAIFHFSTLVKRVLPGTRMDSVTGETEWHSPQACVQAAAQAGAPVVWIGGTEPLFHPEIGEVTSALAASGRYVFLHTSGAGLRQRIHELKPVPRLFLCYEVPVEDSGTSGPVELSSETVAEAIRLSRLSGFLICAHLTVSAPTSVGSVAARIGSLRDQGVDGIVVSSAGALSDATTDASRKDLLAQEVRRIPAEGWRSFSRLLERSYPQTHGFSARERSKTGAPEAGACEETA